MILLDNKIAFLENPKCGSSTLRHYFRQIPKRKWLFKSRKRIDECKYGHSDPDYVHCNLYATINKIYELGYKPSEFKFITSIRDPYDRVQSGINYYKSFHKKNITVKQYLKRYVKNELLRPRYFRFHNHYKVSDFIRVESFHQDMKRISKRYQLKLKIDSSVKKNKKKYIPVTLDDSDILKINELFYEDFMDGGYKKIIPR